MLTDAASNTLLKSLEEPPDHVVFVVGSGYPSVVTQRAYSAREPRVRGDYRAGIASLFTREFYRAASARLGDDGLFVQWLQAYNVDAQTVY